MLSNNLEENKNQLNILLGVGKTFDISYRDYQILDGTISLYYVDGIINNDQIIEIVKVFLKIPHNMTFSSQLIIDNVDHEKLKLENNTQEIVNNILGGLIAILVENYDHALIIDVRNYPGRSISEPDTERVVRGGHDGFTENISINVALVRRRIKDGRLRNEMFNIGSKSPSYVVLSYIEGLCDKQLIMDLRTKLNGVKASHLIMTDKQLEELIIKQKFNPYPLVRYTERPDNVAVHLYQGMFAIFVDNSPSVMLAPITFFDHLQHTEEYRQTPVVGSYLRILRFIGIIVSLFLTPIWFIGVKYNLFEGSLSFLVPSTDMYTGIFMQLLLSEIGVEFLRMASIHTPTALSTSMGLITGVLIGDIAIRVGLLSEQVILLVAISATCTYITPSYELGLANKISKILFVLASGLFGIIGFIVVVIIWVIGLSCVKSFNKPYFYPLIPFDGKKMLKVLFRYRYKN